MHLVMRILYELLCNFYFVFIENYVIIKILLDIPFCSSLVTSKHRELTYRFTAECKDLIADLYTNHPDSEEIYVINIPM